MTLLRDKPDLSLLDIPGPTQNPLEALLAALPQENYSPYASVNKLLNYLIGITNHVSIDIDRLLKDLASSYSMEDKFKMILEFCPKLE